MQYYILATLTTSVVHRCFEIPCGSGEGRERQLGGEEREPTSEEEETGAEEEKDTVRF